MTSKRTPTPWVCPSADLNILIPIDKVKTACNAHDDLVAALKYAHSQMQPFCDDTIVKQALEKAGAE